MADVSCTYGTAKALPANAFTRTGYVFAGWATSVDGEVAYADEASVSTLATSGVTTLYAKWTAISYSVKFNANGGSGTMANESMTYDEEAALTANAFAKTGYTFGGWATSADGDAVYANGQSVKNLTATQGETIDLYAIWTANSYTVKFNANGGTGTMADESMTYDAEKALTACAFTRTGYTFAGWANTANGEVEYVNGATVKNLTATAGGTVTLYAKWTPNEYTVDFNPGQGGTGTMPDQSMTYDEAAALYANLFARTGYTFLGWTDDENEVTEVLYYDGVVVSNLTDEVDGEFDLYAVWAANAYTVRFDANGGEGTMADQAFLYDEAQHLTSNEFVRAGYTFAGWARDTAIGMSLPQLADAEVASNLTAEADGVVTLYAVWDNTGLLDEEETHVDVEKGEIAPYEDAAAVYDGFLYDGEKVVGSVQVKVAKGNVDKKSGVFSAKVTATVQLAGEAKKLSFKGGNADQAGNVSEMTDKNGHALAVTVGVKGLGGTFDGKYKIDGARNVFSGKSDADKSAAEKAMERYQDTYNVAFDGGTLSVAVGKKGKVKVSGTVNGNKVSATSQLMVGDSAAVVPVVIVKKAEVSFCLWLATDGTAAVRGATSGASPLQMIVGKAGTIADGAKFWSDEAAIGKVKGWLTGLYADYLPKGVAVDQDGKKWIVAGGAKAGKLVLDKTTGTLDLNKSKITSNTSGLKLTYKEKDGTFKGSFRAYNLESGKIKSYTASVTGVMIGNTGYGTATIKKLGTVSVTISKDAPVEDMSGM